MNACCENCSTEVELDDTFTWFEKVGKKFVDIKVCELCFDSFQDETASDNERENFHADC